MSSVSVPDHWDKKQIHESGFSKVQLQRSSEEFKRMEALFSATMTGFDITKIERIQNKYLWEIFQLQKNKMKTHNGGSDVTEKLLFHGTDNKYIDAICRDNFDWRICGLNGTAYGRGSYFARDAKYSHSYTGDNHLKTMFISRVLIGSYTTGSSEYCRPPSKDGGDVNFYDSCVNNIQNPSIFVVFDKPQIYPEYLIQYRTTHPLVSMASQASLSTQGPKPTMPPKPTVHHSSSASVSSNPSPYHHSLSMYHSSTSSTRPTSSFQNPASGYGASASSYASSTSSTRPTASSSSQNTASGYGASASSYASSTSSTRPTSSFQNTASGYGANASSYASSTSSTRPTASSSSQNTASRYGASASSYASSSTSSTSSSTLFQTSPVHQPFQDSSTFSTIPRAKPVKRQQDSCVVA